ncbi:predicted protein [Uncinocarpus reesii 1704]|uniref:Uncharacterized protein n=1 Tax=Uncinocarpus reesii (strain UAMH 1704) TaxID=336963 RepID=C4JQ93_UNCRE|nr:uncharacterized protein UREG_04647 [Uncinocarpus reesii 1704]EEP79801.1 predicted protein [Uncinocarpus reesii 1704]
MNQTGTIAQLNFLKRSAEILSSGSPSTSAHLLTVHNQLLHEQSKPISHAQQREFCPSCGTIRSLPLTCTVSSQSRVRKPTRRGRTSPSPSKKSAVVYNCLQCHQQTIHPFEKSEQHQRKKDKLSVNSPPAPRQNNPSPPTTTVASPGTVKAKSNSENASSKKRAKARKQGLLAALQASKPPTTTVASPGTVKAKSNSENASSKKRAKARKQGLLAALQASKPPTTQASSTSLGLLDFLQP